MNWKLIIGMDIQWWETFFERYAKQTIRFRWVILMVVALITGFFLYQMKFLEMDTSTESLFQKGDRTLQIYEEFKETFGNDKFVYILFETDDFFQKETIRLVKNLSLDLEKNVPFVEEMKCLVNVEYVEGRGDEIVVYELMEDFPETPEALETVRRKTMRKPALINNLISPDGKTSAIFLEMEVIPDEKEDILKKVAPKVQEILSKPEYGAFKYHVVGMPILDYEMEKISKQEGARFGLFSFVLEILVLLYIFRGVRGVLAPILVVTLCLIWTLGMICLLGWKLALMFVIIPPLIIAVGICDSVHVISEFNILNNGLQNRTAALVKTLKLVGPPCLLTSLTTAMAFFSFITVEIRPIYQLGVYCGVAFIFAFILSVTLVPIILHFGKNKNTAESGKTRVLTNDIYHRLLIGIGRINRNYPKAVVGFFILVTIISFFGFTKVKFETNTVKSLHRSLPIRQAIEFVDSHMGGSIAIEVVVDTGKDDGLKDIKVLRQIESIQQYLNEQPMVKKTSSIVDLLKDFRQVFHADNPEFYTLPDTGLQAAQYLLMYEQSGGKTLDKLVSFNYSRARITAQVKLVGSAECIGMLRGLREFVRANIDPALKVKYTGAMVWFSTLLDYLQKGQLKSFTVCFIVIAFMMMLVLRSVKLGLISIVPNLFPVIVALGVIGFSGIPLDIFLMLVGSIMIGIAVDDTIHFFLRYRREFNRSGNYEKAMFDTLASVGRPIMFTTLILMVGFLVSISSVDLGIVYFGTIIAIGLFVAMLADFFFVPATMLLLKPLGPDKELESETSKLKENPFSLE